MVEGRLLAGIRMTLNADEYLDALERQYRKALIASRQTKPDVGRIADLKGQIDNLVSAIASDALVPGNRPQARRGRGRIGAVRRNPTRTKSHTA
jgi:hypothetical protein